MQDPKRFECQRVASSTECAFHLALSNTEYSGGPTFIERLLVHDRFIGQWL